MPFAPPLDPLTRVGRRGHVKLAFERRGRRTVQTSSSAASPWHVFPPSELDDSGCAYVWLVNTSGGLVGGDQVSLEASLAADSHVLMTTPSATRVYRTLDAPVEQTIHLSVGQNARLEWIPEVTIPFAGSRFRQSISADLAPGAAALVWDATASGRVARDERWAFASFENEICLTTASGDSVVERFRVEPDRPGHRWSIVSEWDYVASAFVIGDQVPTEVWTRMEEAIAVLLEQWPGQVLGGVSTTAAPGLAIKIVARAAPSLALAQEAVWSCVRAHLWQLPPIALRRY